MLIQNIRRRVQEVANLVLLGDNETAHAMEDALRLDFLRYVEICAREKKWDIDMEQKVAAVLSTQHIKFNRFP